MAAQPAIQLKGLTKTFGSVVANKDIDLDLRHGEILALLGENGSGKTTLMNMLSGLYAPDRGQIYVGGKKVSIHSPHDAQALGIGMIHQHFKLVDVLTVKENIVMGTPGNWSGEKAQDIAAISKRFGMSLDLGRKVYTLSVCEKQTVEILKVLYRGARILILDEPTAVLTPQEIDRLFDILRGMRDEGCAVIIITHKLGEVLALSDRVTILRKGESVATVATKDATAQSLTELMVGRQVDLSIGRSKAKLDPGALTVSHLSVKGQDGVLALDDVSFTVAGGEILGVAGIAGSGQKELCEAIAGLLPVEKGGSVKHHDRELVGLPPRRIIEQGVSMSFVPEDRLGMGLVGGMGMVDNMLLKTYHNQKGAMLSRKGAQALSQQLIEKLDIVTPGVYTPVKRLSGGNVQKVLLGRELASRPDVLITAYPVRGLDINSSMTIYRLLDEEKRRGVAVLYVGEDLDVLLELCDRVLVLCGGRVSGIARADQVNKQQVGLMMTGSTLEEAMASA